MIKIYDPRDLFPGVILENINLQEMMKTVLTAS